ncbi:MAG TPA: ubiquinol-cytochrome c reductase iron-sulfur subunit [Vicinamibacterales bacterium]|nr:ubiquinol-cytochrome c reductase iron-sulfur subunit [Vicinamibacterales bacterium]
MSDADTHISRRKFCAGACSVASGAMWLTLFTACSGTSSSPSSSSSSGATTTLDTLTGQFTGTAVQVTVGGSALANVNGAVLVQSTAGVFLLARTSQNAFSAVDAVCTHEGCTVTGEDGAIYVCPCHGSRYDRSGHVVGGPAPASLRQYAATFAGDVVTIAL